MKFGLATGHGLYLLLLSVTGKLPKYLQIIETPNNSVMYKGETQIYRVFALDKRNRVLRLTIPSCS